MPALIPREYGTILQTIFSHPFPWTKIAFLFKFHWNFFPRSNQQQSCIGSDNGWELNSWQSMISTHEDIVYWCIYASLSFDEFDEHYIHHRFKWRKCCDFRLPSSCRCPEQFVPCITRHGWHKCIVHACINALVQYVSPLQLCMVAPEWFDRWAVVHRNAPVNDNGPWSHGCYGLNGFMGCKFGNGIRTIIWVNHGIINTKAFKRFW